MDADDVALTGDEVDLGQPEVAVVALVLDRLVGDQHVLLGVGVELRSLVPFLQVLPRQLVQADLLGEQGEVVAVGLLEVQPDQRAGLGRQQPLGRMVRRIELRELPVRAANQQGASGGRHGAASVRGRRSADAGEKGHGRVAVGLILEDQLHLAAIPADPQGGTPPVR